MNPIEPHTLTPYAASLERVPYTGIRELGEAAMAMDGVLRLYFGESNVPTPQFIVDAAVRALADGYTFYSENAGLPSLRRALADQYRRLHDVTLDAEREIVITASGLAPSTFAGEVLKALHPDKLDYVNQHLAEFAREHVGRA